jgi:uncharacterized protein YbjT (DUF2867 family)
MNTILVTGATGNVGRPLVANLSDAGAQVRAVNRRPDTAGLPAGVEVVASAAAGLAGATAAFLNSRALGGELSAMVDLATVRDTKSYLAESARHVRRWCHDFVTASGAEAG